MVNAGGNLQATPKTNPQSAATSTAAITRPYTIKNSIIMSQLVPHNRIFSGATSRFIKMSLAHTFTLMIQIKRLLK